MPRPSKPSGPSFSLRSVLLFLFLANLALFGSFLSPHGDRVLSKMGEDLWGQFLAWRQFGFEELGKGHLALWDPHLFCGAPYLGGFQSALLYPPNWLFMVLPLPLAVNLSIALHVFLAAFFTYLWVQRRGSHPLSALMAGLGFAWGASYFLHIVPGHLSNLCTMVWIPLILLAVDGWREERKFRWLLLGMGALAFQIFAGHIQYVYYTAVFLVFYVPLGLAGTSRKVLCFCGLSLMGLGAAMLSAVQLLTGLDAAAESARSQHLSLDLVDVADITPERLWSALVPGFFGGWADYWGGGMYPEGAVFISVAAFVLAFYGLAVSKDPRKRILGGLALLFTLVAVGKRGPLFSLFYKFFPMFGQFRGIGKFNVFISLCLLALAALGMDEVLRRPKDSKGLFRGLAIGAGVLWVVAIVFELAPARLFKQFAPHAGQMAGALLASGVLLGILALLAWATVKRPVLGYGFLIVSFVELFLFAKGNQPFFNIQDWTDKEQSLQKVYRDDPGNYRVHAHSTNDALSTGALDIWGEDPMIPLRYARFAAATQHLDVATDISNKPFFTQFPPALGLLRLRYVLNEKEGKWNAERLALPESPRAYFAEDWEVLAPEQILDQVSDPHFKPVPKVLLESDPGFKPQDEGLFQSKVEVADLSTDQLEVKAQLSKPGILVVTDNYSKGWKVEPVPGEGTGTFPVVPVFGFQRGVALPAGDHHFFLVYQPSVFGWGWKISLLSWLLFLGFLVVPFLRTPRPSRQKKSL